jgi:hypothetical protein
MPFSATDKLLLEKIDSQYSDRALTAPELESYARLRGAARELAHLIVELCPDCHQRDCALNELQTAMLCASGALSSGTPR